MPLKELKNKSDAESSQSVQESTRRTTQAPPQQQPKTVQQPPLQAKIPTPTPTTQPTATLAKQSKGVPLGAQEQTVGGLKLGTPTPPLAKGNNKQATPPANTKNTANGNVKTTGNKQPLQGGANNKLNPKNTAVGHPTKESAQETYNKLLLQTQQKSQTKNITPPTIANGNVKTKSDKQPLQGKNNLGKNTSIPANTKSITPANNTIANGNVKTKSDKQPLQAGLVQKNNKAANQTDIKQNGKSQNTVHLTSATTPAILIPYNDEQARTDGKKAAHNPQNREDILRRGVYATDPQAADSNQANNYKPYTPQDRDFDNGRRPAVGKDAAQQPAVGFSAKPAQQTAQPAPKTNPQTRLEPVTKAVIKAVTEAVRQIAQNPTLKGISATQGAGHLTRWQQEIYPALLKNTPNPTTSAALGYVIESLATEKILNQSITGFNITAQYRLNNSRPDIAVLDNTTQQLVGLFDFTASKSVGHIYSQKANDPEWSDSSIFVAEVLFPSLEDNTLDAFKEWCKLFGSTSANGSDKEAAARGELMAIAIKLIEKDILQAESSIPASRGKEAIQLKALQASKLFKQLKEAYQLDNNNLSDRTLALYTAALLNRNRFRIDSFDTNTLQELEDARKKEQQHKRALARLAIQQGRVSGAPEAKTNNAPTKKQKT